MLILLKIDDREQKRFIPRPCNKRSCERESAKTRAYFRFFGADHKLIALFLVLKLKDWLS